MNNENATYLFFICILGAVMFFFMHGVMYVTNDFRLFSEIVKECKEHGRIQDNKTRINCTVVME